MLIPPASRAYVCVSTAVRPRLLTSSMSYLSSRISPVGSMRNAQSMAKVHDWVPPWKRGRPHLSRRLVAMAVLIRDTTVQGKIRLQLVLQVKYNPPPPPPAICDLVFSRLSSAACAFIFKYPHPALLSFPRGRAGLRFRTSRSQKVRHARTPRRSARDKRLWCAAGLTLNKVVRDGVGYT